MSEENQTDASTEQSGESEDADVDVSHYIYLGALGVLVVLAVVGLFGFYTSATEVIDVWVAQQYQPIFRAVFNLVVLLAAAAGIARLAPLVRETD